MMQGENNFHKRFLDCIINFRIQKNACCYTKFKNCNIAKIIIHEKDNQHTKGS